MRRSARAGPPSTRSRARRSRSPHTARQLTGAGPWFLGSSQGMEGKRLPPSLIGVYAVLLKPSFLSPGRGYGMLLVRLTTQEAPMYARVARFQGDPSQIDESAANVRAQVESGVVPAGLEGAKMMMFVDRQTGEGLGITLFDSEEAMRRGDEALNEMSPGGGSERTGVTFYEVPVSTV